MSTQKQIGFLTALAVLAAAFAIPALWNGDARAADPAVTAPSPALAFDIGVKKTHPQPGGPYSVSVQNMGALIPAGWKIEITEIVPDGLVVTSAGVPWACTPPPSLGVPAVGPDAFVCSYIVPPGGLPTTFFAPPLTITAHGQHHCPNCVRARLYHRQSPALPWLLVNETNTINNASCAQ